MAKVRRPVWLFSMDSDQFRAPPTTTGGLLAFYQRHGRTVEQTDVELVHFKGAGDIDLWLQQGLEQLQRRAQSAARCGLRPVFGFSCYTWNTDLFLELMQRLVEACPAALCIAGGPQVQKPEDYLGKTPIDVIALGEAEVTFQEWLDCAEENDYFAVNGLAFLDDGGMVHRTPERARETQLDRFPSALDVISLRDENGQPCFTQVAYETSRGCPFRCAYCEWGTGAIGTKMYQFSLERIRSDLERLIEGGIQDVWLSDSNFGALKEDLDKAHIIVELRKRTGLPNTFATSWSKAHNGRVQEIVLLLQRNALLQNYNLALQTLTPLALKLSHRTNMRSNRYEPIAREMTREGVPIATELIWGLPGDTLAEFEANLDRLLTFFPNINIFGYTLLPGTEFYEKRDDYRLETIPVAGYGAAKGEYVIGCHTFEREEGLEGYFLISAHILLIRGHIMPFTVRLMALEGRIPVSPMLRELLAALLTDVQGRFPDLDLRERMTVYEHRAALYLALLDDVPRTFAVLSATLDAWLLEHEAVEGLRLRCQQTLRLDQAVCPRTGPKRIETQVFDYDVRAVEQALSRMEMPESERFDFRTPHDIAIDHPAHVGEILRDPDGGSWMRGKLV